MNFTFRFDSVLRVRRYQKRKEKQKLGMLYNQKAAIEQQMNALEKRCRTNTFSPGKQSMADNRRYYTQKHTRHKQLIRLKEELDKMNEQIKEQRGKLSKAVKRLRVMEKLKDRDRKAFIDRVEHVEQLRQNEIAIQRYNSGR